MIKKLIFSICLLSSLNAFSCEIPLEFNFCVETTSSNCYEFSLYKSDIKDGHFTKELKDGVTIKGEISDCRGVLNFELIDSNQDLKIKGHFMQGLDTLKEQMVVVDPITGDTFYTLYTYFEPLRNGLWVYTHLDNSLIKKEVFEKGLIK